MTDDTDPLASQRDAENSALEREAPELFSALSPLGRRATFPPDIPAQAAEARGTTYNATIGQITDGHGRPLNLPSMAAAASGLGEQERAAFFLYSAIGGIDEVRRRWREWQRRELHRAVESTLPIVSAGLTSGLAIVADLFAAEGQTVVVPAPYWGNYRQVFGLRRGARVVAAPMFAAGRYDPRAVPKALDELPSGETAIVVLNIPSNPTGYSPTAGERRELVAGLAAAAERRRLVVVCDDAYAGLVFEPEIPALSIFWELCGIHPALTPVKVDGATKEFAFFGGRVGFVTFALDPESDAAMAMESKSKCLVRAALGSPVAASQVVLLAALRNPDIQDEIAAVREQLARRYRTLRECLAAADQTLVRPLPFNSGCFALVELPPSVKPHDVRRHLLTHEDTGLVASGESYLRIAFCSVDNDEIPELVRRLERGVAHMVGARVD